jgi:hypothetical protein
MYIFLRTKKSRGNLRGCACKNNVCKKQRGMKPTETETPSPSIKRPTAWRERDILQQFPVSVSFPLCRTFLSVE